tara:strand:+ start:135 stop:1385 length:1251 start_codon:yes stop_codon:yes gene_type:complete
MAFRSKRFVDTNASIPLNRLATPTQISSYIKRIINASQYDYHETEAFEVDKVIMNETQNHGAVMGNFINNPKQEIKGGVVLPLMPNISMIPLKGEHVVVVEYNGQHYYTGIINRTNSVNENALPGTSDTYKQNTKYGNTFERKDIRRVHVCEGEIVYEGRFGNSIKLGCNHKNNTPNIRIRAGQQPTSGSIGNVIKENINEDKSSIYLSTNETIELDGLSTSGGRSFGEESIKGNSIVMNSDKLFFNAKNGNVNVRASKDLILQGDEVFIHANKGRTIKLGPPGAIFIPTLNSEVIGELFFLLIDVITDIQIFSPKLATPATAVSAAADLVKLGTVKLPKILNIVKNELYLNKDILVPDPRILFSRKKKKKRKRKELVTSVENAATRDDGTFDSENFERPAKRDADGNRSVGPRKY